MGLGGKAIMFCMQSSTNDDPVFLEALSSLDLHAAALSWFSFSFNPLFCSFISTCSSVADVPYSSV